MLWQPVTVNVADPVSGLVLRVQVCNRCNPPTHRSHVFSTYCTRNLDDIATFEKARSSNALMGAVHPWAIKGKDGREV